MFVQAARLSEPSLTVCASIPLLPCMHRHMLFQCRPVDIRFMTIWTGHTVASFATATSFTVALKNDQQFQPLH